MTPTHLNGQARTDFEASLRKLIRDADKEWIDEPVSELRPDPVANQIESSELVVSAYSSSRSLLPAGEPPGGTWADHSCLPLFNLLSQATATATGSLLYA
jgi:hypothetical protein